LTVPVAKETPMLTAILTSVLWAVFAALVLHQARRQDD
jgi:hypothetical protein